MTATKSKEEVIPLGGVSRRVGAGYCESLTVDTLAMARGRESPSYSRPDMSAIVTRFGLESTKLSHCLNTSRFLISLQTKGSAYKLVWQLGLFIYYFLCSCTVYTLHTGEAEEEQTGLSFPSFYIFTKHKSILQWS